MRPGAAALGSAITACNSRGHLGLHFRPGGHIAEFGAALQAVAASQASACTRDWEHCCLTCLRKHTLFRTSSPLMANMRRRFTIMEQPEVHSEPYEDEDDEGAAVFAAPDFGISISGSLSVVLQPYWACYGGCLHVLQRSFCWEVTPICSCRAPRSPPSQTHKPSRCGEEKAALALAPHQEALSASRSFDVNDGDLTPRGPVAL